MDAAFFLAQVSVPVLLTLRMLADCFTQLQVRSLFVLRDWPDPFHVADPHFVEQFECQKRKLYITTMSEER
jgi:hypothetical protein